VADADAAEAVVEMDRIDFSKLDVIFDDMVFRASFLAMFVNKVSAEKVTLKFGPHQYHQDGVVRKMPVVVEYSIGEKTSFRFVLSPHVEGAEE
jgi:hypothetical protein